MRMVVLMMVVVVSNACSATSRTSDAVADLVEADAVFADVYNSTSSRTRLPVRGRLIEEEPSDFEDPGGRSLEEIRQDEIDDALVAVRLIGREQTLDVGAVRTDDEGYFDAVFELDGVEAGRYQVEYRVEGVRVGLGQATLLELDRTLPVVRSDVDLTYLETDFHSAGAMLRLLDESADDKVALPAMERVYPALRGDDALPLTFLSGSPRFFKRAIERKMANDGVVQDGLVLKPFKDIVTSNLADLDFDELLPELREQVGYKLYWLLRLRQDLPAATPEILMGDDSEADFVVYALYHRFMSGAWDVERVDAELASLGVADEWRSRVTIEAQRVEIGTPPSVIYINATEVAAGHFDLDAWSVPGVTRHHRGAWPLILDLFEEGWVDDADVESVRERLVATGETTESLHARASAAGFLDTATLERF